MSIEFAEHQKNAIAFQQAHSYSITAMATGTGKSATTIGSQLNYLNQNKLDKCIFVCTKGSLGEVLNDYNKFFNFTPTQLYDTNSIDSFFRGDSTVAVTRYEWLKHFDPELMRQYQSNRLGMWWDEAQRLKNGSKDSEQVSGTLAHKSAKELRKHCDVFNLVTATPIMTSLDDLWGLMHLVDKNVLYSYEDFSNNFYVKQKVPHPRYAKRLRKLCPTCRSRLIFTDGWSICPNPACQSIQTPTGFIPYRERVRWIWDLVEYKNIDLLSKIMQNYMFCFYPKQDINYYKYEFDLTSDIENEYIKIAKGIANEDDDVPFATRMIELQYLIDRCYEKKNTLFKLANKLKKQGFVLYTSLYNTEGKLSSTTTLEEIEKVLNQVEGLEYRAYSGRENDEDRDTNKAWFQEDPTNKCLIITEAGGASLNLQVTNQFIFYNLPAGFGKMSQAFGRVVRLFSTFKSFDIHFILGKHSVDTYKFICFLMYEELMTKLLNNRLISTEKPISFNNKMKQLFRQDLLWRN